MPPTAPVNEFAHTTVLIIDDDPTYRFLLRGICGRLGIGTIEEAEDGEQGLAAAQRLNPDIIRFDLSKTQSLDSHWLGTFIRIFRRAKEQQIDMIIEHASADVRRLFSLVQIDRIITITP